MNPWKQVARHQPELAGRRVDVLHVELAVARVGRLRADADAVGGVELLQLGREVYPLEGERAGEVDLW